jgi:3-dehydroquinate synthase
MVVAVEYARQANLLTTIGIDHAGHLISHVRSMIGEGLVAVMDSPPSVDLALVMEKFNNDKKHRTEHYRMVVPQADGELELISVPRTDATRSSIEAAYLSGLRLIGYPGF